MLEIGCGPIGELARLLLEREKRVREIVGIDPALPSQTTEEGPLRLSRMHAETLELPDGSFDLVYSLATFEHLLRLDRVLAEIRRVLAPGGMLVARWSPIWSGWNGHHYGRSVTGNEGESDIALPWAHHMFDAASLPHYLEEGESFGTEEAKRTTHFVHESTALNRFWCRDYARILNASGLEVVELDASRAALDTLLPRARSRVEDGALDSHRLAGFLESVHPEEYLAYRLDARLRRP